MTPKASNRRTPASPPPAPSAADEGRRRRLDALLDGLAAGRGIRHAVLAVESLDGSLRWAGARGSATPDGTPMRDETPYYIASIDKLFTAVAVLKLHERGGLDLEAPVATYLEPSLVRGIHRHRGRDRSERITVRNLLAHTSGLANYLEDRPRGGKALVETLTTEGDRSWTIEDVTRIVREDLTPHFEPQAPRRGRQRVRYSDTNYALLHAVVESVTGRPLHEVFEAELFAPLGLGRTWMAGRPRGAAGTPAPATLWAGEAPLEIPLAMASLGGIYSTVHDQLRFMRALVTGGIFADPATFDLMRARWNRFGFPSDAASLRAPSWPIEYGLGIKRFRVPRPLTGSWSMPALLGHSGSTGTWLFHAPELGVTIAGAVDQVTAGAVPYRFLPRATRALAP